MQTLQIGAEVEEARRARIDLIRASSSSAEGLHDVVIGLKKPLEDILEALPHHVVPGALEPRCAGQEAETRLHIARVVAEKRTRQSPSHLHRLAAESRITRNSPTIA